MQVQWPQALSPRTRAGTFMFRLCILCLGCSRNPLKWAYNIVNLVLRPPRSTNGLHPKMATDFKGEGEEASQLRGPWLTYFVHNSCADLPPPEVQLQSISIGNPDAQFSSTTPNDCISCISECTVRQKKPMSEHPG